MPEPKHKVDKHQRVEDMEAWRGIVMKNQPQQPSDKITEPAASFQLPAALDSAVIEGKKAALDRDGICLLEGIVDEDICLYLLSKVSIYIYYYVISHYIIILSLPAAEGK